MLIKTRIKKRNKKKNIEKNIRQRFIMISVITMFLSMTISTYFYVRHTTQTAVNSMNTMMQFYSEAVNEIIFEGDSLLQIVQDDITVQSAIRNSVFATNKELYIQKISMNSYIRILANNYAEYADGVYILLKDGRNFKSSVYPVHDIEFTKSDWYQSMINATGIIYSSSYDNSKVIDNVPYGYFYIGKSISNYRTGEVVGVILVEYKTVLFEKILDQITESEDLNISVCNDRKEVIWELGILNYSLHNSFLYHLTTISLSKELTNGWMTVTTGNWLQSIQRELLISGSVLLIGIIVIVIFSIFFAVRFSKSITAPIYKLLQHIKHIDEQWLNDQLEIQTQFDETDKLIRGFNKMVQKINALFEKEKESEINMRNAHFMALQAQINPHFLYNSLDHVTWQIRLGRHEEATNTLISLSKYFRLSLNMGDELITLKMELEHANYYLHIQNLRYQDQISYEIHNQLSDQDMENLKVPKFILQPLVENAINHGIRDSEEKGVIIITLWNEDTNALITVFDSGLGIPQEKLDKFNELLGKGELSERERSGGYGLFNVNQRIKYVFGNKYGLKLESCMGQYTISKIILPHCKAYE